MTQPAKPLSKHTRRACIARIGHGLGVVALSGIDQVWAQSAPSSNRSYIARDISRIEVIPNTVRSTVHRDEVTPLVVRKQADPVALVRNTHGMSSETIPYGYVAMGDRNSVPAWFLYGIALQESKILFGRRALPYPWTLNVKGQGKRYNTYEEALVALKWFVSNGLTSVDIGCMQVNWRWHGARLQTLERALEPYANIDAGAQILRAEYAVTRDWFKTAMQYHAGVITASNRQRATDYANSVFNRLERMGIRHA